MFLSPSDKRKLRQHAIFLDDSTLSDAFGLNPDVQIESILGYDLPLFIAQRRAEGSKAPIPVMFWSHGGNVMRNSAIDEALRYIDIWINNGIYPIYFLWDTGPVATAVDAIKEIIRPDAADHEKLAKVHEVFHQTTWDEFFDAAARLAQIPGLWQEMIQAAEASNKGTGGGRVFVNSLAEKKSLRADIELHAVGHSAGAVFHAHFTPLLLDKGFGVKTLQMLAPAIRIEAYAAFLKKLDANNQRVGSTLMFTMDTYHELRDKMLHKLYQNGSLLYFIRDVLDPAWDPALLGLEVCLNEASDDVWNSFAHVTLTPTGHGALPGQESAAASHTAFSSDPATLNSVAYNILGTAPTHLF